MFTVAKIPSFAQLNNKPTKNFGLGHITVFNPMFSHIRGDHTCPIH